MKNQRMTNTVTQVSILNALLASRFDGCLPCRELLEYGDLGIGTFDRMEGEMVMVDGSIYQAKADGRVYTPDLDNRTPFATVCRFHPDETWTLSEPINLEALEKVIDEKVANPNVFCAVRVEGSFSYMKTHALQIQSKPYPPTAEVVRACVQFEMKDVSGTIVGFRGPPYVRGINDTGYHLHFLSDDKTQGGHILEFVMDRGTCAINICSNHFVILPEDGAALAGIDMSRDLVDEFHHALSGEG
ncbi:MAG: acetolactate decarboxylase [Rhodoplanes sp.]|jgi:acetolactate decarboxylase